MGSFDTNATIKLIAHYAVEIIKYRDQEDSQDMIFCVGLLHGHLFALSLQSIDIKKICVEACKLIDKNNEIIKVIMATYEDVKNRNDQILGAMLIHDALR